MFYEEQQFSENEVKSGGVNKKQVKMRRSNLNKKRSKKAKHNIVN